jgi:uncharacterized membrane protein
MTPEVQPDQLLIGNFLADLRARLAPITLAEREEILREIAAHIHDSIELNGLPAATVIARLGTPQQLAADFRDGALVREARYSVSPTLLLRATLRIASKGFAGMVVFFCGLVGYLTGISFIIAALLKPFLPGRTGVFVVHHQLYRIGVQATAPPVPVHEVAGYMFIPASLAVGCVAVIVTTFAIRRFLRISSKWQNKLANGATSWKAIHHSAA